MRGSPAAAPPGLGLTAGLPMHRALSQAFPFGTMNPPAAPLPAGVDACPTAAMNAEPENPGPGATSSVLAFRGPASVANPTSWGACAGAL